MNTVNNNYFDNDSSDNDISNINMKFFVDVSKINPKSSTLILTTPAQSEKDTAARTRSELRSALPMTLSQRRTVL